MNVPDHLVYPLKEFDAEFSAKARIGEAHLRWSSVAFVGLARNCAPWLDHNLQRLKMLADACGAWTLHIETNDNEDDTADVLRNFCQAYPQASFRDQTLGRQQFGAEFAGPRTIALAEYRAACQHWVARNAADFDYVVVIDWDAWGGWSHAGVMNGFGHLATNPDAYGMASVSLMEHVSVSVDEKQKASLQPAWLGYDAWAFRWNTYLDAYTRGQGGWFHQWLPFVGSPPLRVCSAFGGLCIYRTDDYLHGTYDGRTDCEHTEFHRTIAERTGRSLYYNPSQRTVMRWLEREATDGGHNSND